MDRGDHFVWQIGSFKVMVKKDVKTSSFARMTWKYALRTAKYTNLVADLSFFFSLSHYEPLSCLEDVEFQNFSIHSFQVSTIGQ